jgi:peroxiredoxin
MRLLLSCLFAAGALLPMRAEAGKYNEKLSIGDVAPSWSDLPGTDGKTHSLDDLKAKPVVVVIFTCASCPYAQDYEERINSLVKAQGGPDGKVGVVAICVNNIEADSLPALTARAKEKKLEFDYLYDKTQKIAKDFGAVFTPEFYVLDQDRKVIYMGAMDDATDVTKVKKKYVESAIAAALAGKAPEEMEVAPVGCMVRYARERRRK